MGCERWNINVNCELTLMLVSVICLFRILGITLSGRVSDCVTITFILCVSFKFFGEHDSNSYFVYAFLPRVPFLIA